MGDTARKPEDVLDLVIIGLKAHGFDGLWSEDGCACLVDDLAPCGAIQNGCMPGYKVDYGGRCPGGECDGHCDWHVQNTKVEEDGHAE